MKINENAAETELKKLAANTVRILVAEAVQKANSGHPGMPMGMADVAVILWTEILNHNPNDPKWINRDRFVLSAGHGSMLLYSMLYLSGYDCSIEDLKNFRQWGSRTPGHPEHGILPGVETTTGPLGQGFGNGIGMALAAKMMAARFNDEHNRFVGDHFIYGIVSDGDLMEGVSHEAASIAGHLKLNNVIYFYDDNKITIDGSTKLAFSEDIKKRFEAYGWSTSEISAYNHDEIRDAIVKAQNEKEKPSLIITKSHIGYGSPNKVDTAEVHGSALGQDEVEATKKNLNWNYEKEFFVPEQVKEIFNNRKKELLAKYGEWNKNFNDWKRNNPIKASLLAKFLECYLPDELEKELIAAVPKEPAASRSLSSKVIQKISELVPNLIGGSADLHPSTNTYMEKFDAISSGNYNGRNIHYGIREHGMGSILNGISLYGGFRTFGATFFVFSDYMRPTIRLASLMELPVIYVFTHDSIFLGEDGPTHQPIEHLAVLRAIPNLTLFRPADGYEVAMAWSYALRNRKYPVAIILTRQKIEKVIHDESFEPEDILKGAYIVSRERSEKPDLILAASGSELPVVIEAKNIMDNNLGIRVVSIPSKEIIEKQDDEYISSIFPDGVPVVIVEAAEPYGWGDLFRGNLLTIGINRFGASAPYKILQEKFGFTAGQIANKISEWLA